MADGKERSLRLEDEKIAAILAELDAAAMADGPASRRNAKRFAYRPRTVEVECNDPNGDAVKYLVRPRDISRDGMAFLASTFIYPGSACRVRLVSEYDHALVVGATVKRCRYLHGTGSVHEVGVTFQHPIDVALFHRGASTTRLLIADEDSFQRQLAERLLKPLSVRLTYAESGDEVLEKATAESFDLLLIDVDSPAMKALEVVKQLRVGGYSRPIVSMTATNDASLCDKSREAGCTDHVAKPLTRDVLEGLLDSVRVEPLVSTLIHEPDMADLIDTFVAELERRVSELESAFAKEELETLTRVGMLIKSQAGACGFEVITKVANALCECIGADEGKVAIRDKLDELVRWCNAARPANFTSR